LLSSLNVPIARFGTVMISHSRADGNQQGSRGLADLDSHTAIGSETSFSIGSVSKQFIAIGVLLLEQQARARSVAENGSQLRDRRARLATRR
jgi:CubicO group peptidase (beta-lactamase class C family)